MPTLERPSPLTLWWRTDEEPMKNWWRTHWSGFDILTLSVILRIEFNVNMNGSNTTDRSEHALSLTHNLAWRPHLTGHVAVSWWLNMQCSLVKSEKSFRKFVQSYRLRYLLDHANLTGFRKPMIRRTEIYVFNGCWGGQSAPTRGQFNGITGYLTRVTRIRTRTRCAIFKS